MTWSVIGGNLPFGYTLDPSTGTISGFAEAAQIATFTVLVADSSGPAQAAVKSFSIPIFDLPGELLNPGLDYPYLLSDHGFVAESWREFTWPGFDSPHFYRNISTKIEGNSAQALWKGSAPWRGGILQHVPVVPGKPFSVAFSGGMESDESGDFNVQIGIGIADGITENPNDMVVTDFKWDHQADLRVANAFQAAITPTRDHVTVFLFAWNQWAFATRVSFDAGSATQGVVKVLTETLPPAIVGSSYSATLLATAGTPPYTWNVITGVLPAGLILNPATGTIDGTPTAVETQTFVVRAVDAAATPQEASRRLTIATGVPPGIMTPPANATAAAGALATFTVVAGGTEPFFYQWQKGKVNIPGAQADTLTTLVTTEDNNTAYRVVVSNFVGTAISDPATLTVTSVPAETPFLGTAFAIPGTIQAEDFDNGGEGVAYHDAEPQNFGGAYRPAEGVDIEPTTDAGGGFNVGWVHGVGGPSGPEWLQYTVNVAESGSYTIEARVSSAGPGGTFHIEFAGVGGVSDPDFTFTVPDTGGWQSWQSIMRKGVGLSAGQQVMRIAMDADGPSGFVCNFNYIRITSENRLATPFSPGMVEINLPYDVAGLTLTPDSGSPVAMTRLTPRHAMGFIPLSSVGGVSDPDPTGYTIAVGGASGPDSTVLASTLTWTPTNLTGSSPGGNVIAMRQGDSLLLTATGSGTTLQIDGDGDGIYEHTGAPGDRFAHAHNSTGTFVATAKIDGAVVGSATVKVISVDLGGPIACQVGFQRTRRVVVSPASEIAQVLFAADDFTPMNVSLAEVTPTGVRLNLQALARGTPALLARIGGADGPIAAYREVDEFTTIVGASQILTIDPDTGIGTTVLYMTPYVGDVIVTFDMFASLSRFNGGITSFTVDTSLDFIRVANPETGEDEGRFIYEIEVPPGETACCFNVDYAQRSGLSKGVLEKPGEPDHLGLRYGPSEDEDAAGRDHNNNPDPDPNQAHVILVSGGEWGTLGPLSNRLKRVIFDERPLIDGLQKKGYHFPEAFENVPPEFNNQAAIDNQNAIEKELRFDDGIHKKIIIDFYTKRQDLEFVLRKREVRSIIWIGHGNFDSHKGESYVKARLGDIPSAPDKQPGFEEVYVSQWAKIMEAEKKRRSFPYDYLYFSNCWAGGRGGIRGIFGFQGIAFTNLGVYCDSHIENLVTILGPTAVAGPIAVPNVFAVDREIQVPTECTRLVSPLRLLELAK